MITPQYELAKCIWSEEDFDQMGWHDATIYAMALMPVNFEFVLDIDYILRWNPPNPPEADFAFWVVPATLVFENVYDLEFDISSHDGSCEIDGIKRERETVPRNALLINRPLEWQWIITCQQGSIKLKATGFKQYCRMTPQFGQRQTVDLDLRVTPALEETAN